MKTKRWTYLWILLIGSAFALPAFAAEEKKKDESKITGTIVEVAADPSGRLASVALKTDREQILLMSNAVTKKISKHVGKKADVTGKLTESGGIKIMEPWVFQRKEDSGK
jgi:hypothetical protein